MKYTLSRQFDVLLLLQKRWQRYAYVVETACQKPQLVSSVQGGLQPGQPLTSLPPH
jgi:hypothetical protein